ncbi:methyl-accepting chemotaxis protein [Bacillus kwashiorkori]|uniref:methyl-accepting chemotaxis protein n=1 Tax=Bacillus kwashiorkori TaxID=1522318 RepID=UPI000782041F|nr:methyl-accepting chemotaxis protein [Bacillus kwashiorkori]
MEKRTKYKFGLRKKLVIFTTTLAVITYSTSAIFIYVLYPMFFSDYINQFIFTMSTLLLGIIWSGVLAFFAAQLLIKPLKQLEEAAKKTALGDITHDVVLSKSDDEIRAVGKAFNQMLANLRNMVAMIDTNFTATNEKVIEISKEATRAHDQAECISRTVSEISHGAENSAVSVAATAEAIEDVMFIAKDVLHNAKTAETISDEMINELQTTRSILNSLISGVEQMASQNKESLSAVKRLADTVQKIEQIILLVGEIAKQTNLLALNASIEAARAGEHGKGFAVVAEEVRKLADESESAVKNISELITSIQQEVHHVVEEIAEQVEEAQNEVKKGEQSNESLEKMTKTIFEVANSVKTIANLVDKQMISIERTSSQSQDVAAIAEETSAAAEEVAASTDEQTNVIGNLEEIAIELKLQAEKLHDTIKEFHR